MVNALSLVDALFVLGGLAQVVAGFLKSYNGICSMNIKEELTKSPVDGNAALAKDLQASAVDGAGFILPGRLGAEIHNMT